MKLKSVFLLTALTLIVSAGDCSAATINALSVQGATPEEGAQVNAVLSGPWSPGMFDQLLRDHPDNKAALLLRATYRWNTADIAGATADMDHLKELAPDFPGLYGNYANLYAASGAAPQEIAALEAYIKEAQNNANKQLTDYYKARVRELSGDLIGALDSWNAAIKSVAANPSTAAELKRQAAQFELRHKMVKAAIADLEALTAPGAEDEKSQTTAQVTLGIAYWMDGRKDDALRLLNTANTTYRSKPDPDPGVEALGALAAFSLAGPITANSSPTDIIRQRDAKAALEHAQPLLENVSDLLGSTIAILLGQPNPDLPAHLQTVLQAAPGLEWAQWSAFFLSINHVEGAPPLLPLIPEATLPGSLAHALENESKK